MNWFFFSFFARLNETEICFQENEKSDRQRRMGEGGQKREQNKAKKELIKGCLKSFFFFFFL